MTKAHLEMDFAVSVLGWIEEEFALTDTEIAQALGIDPTTTDRWRTRAAAPTSEQRKRIEEFAQLKRLLEIAFRTPELGRQWLRRAVPALQGRMPISAITGGQIDCVLGVLATHAAGVYV